MSNPDSRDIPTDVHDGDGATQTTLQVGGFRFAAATFFAVGAASTLAQILAVSSLGLPVAWDWSTGGLIAGIAAIWMWVKCRSWVAWRRWVWLPIGITVVVAFVTINLMVASARETAEREAAAELQRMCSAAQIELTEREDGHAALIKQTWDYQGVPFGWREDWVPTPPSGSGADWDYFDEIAGRPTQTDVWNFYVANGGPQMESDITALRTGLAADCAD